MGIFHIQPQKYLGTSSLFGSGDMTLKDWIEKTLRLMLR
jgi:hypothetical protein